MEKKWERYKGLFHFSSLEDTAVYLKHPLEKDPWPKSALTLICIHTTWWQSSDVDLYDLLFKISTRPMKFISYVIKE